jgi:hypothetical protein
MRRNYEANRSEATKNALCKEQETTGETNRYDKRFYLG